MKLKESKQSSVIILFTLIEIAQGPLVDGLDSNATCDLPHPLKRQGTTQAERYRPALLDPEYYKLDERTWKDLMLQSYRLASYINYFDANHLASPGANWQPFFAEFIDAVRNKVNEGAYTRAKANQDIEPHLALLTAFLQLFKYAQDDLNNVLQRYTDFYYNDVLQLKQKSAVPDTVAVFFELNKNADQVKIDKLSPINAGKDSGGNKLIYLVNDDLIVNQGKVASLKALYLRSSANAFRSFHAAKAINAGDFISSPILDTPPSWPPYGSDKLPEVKLGFAISSPVFFLPEGDRQITLTFQSGSNLSNVDFVSLINPFSVEFSSTKGWVQATVTLSSKNVMVIQIPKGSPDVSIYNEAIHLLQLENVSMPVLKFYLQDSSRYSALQHFSFQSIQIDVNVTGAHNLILQNDLGTLDSSKPFFPFTNQPTKNASNFYIGYPYAFNKYLTGFTITGRWRNQPADIHSYYAAYTESALPNAMQDAEWKDFPLKDLHGQPYGLNAGNWVKMPLTNTIAGSESASNDQLATTFDVYDNFSIATASFSQEPLMQQLGGMLSGITVPNSTAVMYQAAQPFVQAIDPNIIQTQFFNNAAASGGPLFTNEINPDLPPLYDVTTKEGFVKFVNGYDFGHSQYTNLLSTSILQAQTEKVAGSNGLYSPARFVSLPTYDNSATEVGLIGFPSGSLNSMAAYHLGGSGYVGMPKLLVVDLKGTGSGASITGINTNGVITGLYVEHAGSGYQRPIGIMGGGHPGDSGKAHAVVGTSGNDNKKIISIVVDSPGSGYTVAPSVFIFDNTGAGRGAVAKATVENGKLKSISVVSKGGNYSAGFGDVQVLLFSGGGQSVNGAPAIIAAPTFTTSPNNNQGPITRIDIISGGTGYIVPPSITIIDAMLEGSDAKAVAELTNGVVTNIKILDGGEDYINPVAILCADNGGGGVLMPNTPYSPEVASIELNYQLSATYDASDALSSVLYHLHPFGVELISGAEKSLLPTYTEEGNLFIGISNLKVSSIISLYFKIQEGSGNKFTSIDGIQPRFFYLAGNQFVALDMYRIVKDTTDMLTNSGIIQISLPQDAISSHTVMPDGLIWLKISLVNSSDGFPRMIDIQAQAAEAVFVDNNNASDHLKYPLPAGSVKGMVNKVEGLKKVSQPYESEGGKMQESKKQFDTRVSELLRHKHRNWTMWDTEHLILEQFPSIYKVKCISHTNHNVEYAPGSIKVLLVSNLVNQSNQDILKPGVSQSDLIKVKKFVQKYSSPFVRVFVENPQYEKLKLSFGVAFRQQYADFSYYRQKLQDDLILHIAPWIGDNSTGLTFSGILFKSRLLDFIEDRPYVDYVTDFQVIKYDVNDVPMVCDEEITCSNESVILTSFQSHDIKVGVC